MNQMCQVVYVVIVLACQSVFADGLFHSVAQEGAWIEFETVNHLFGPEARESTVRRLWITRAFGYEERNGKRCQWIEVEETNLAADSEKSTWNRYLIPSVHLELRNATPFDVIEHRRGSGNGSFTVNPGPISEARFRMYFPGLLVSSVENRDRTITYRGGTLKCEKCIRQNLTSGDGTETVEIDYTLWPHDGVPFGVAAATIELRRSRNVQHHYTWHREFSLLAFGHGETADSSIQDDSEPADDSQNIALRDDLSTSENVDAQPDLGVFDEFVIRVLKEWQVPGVAIAVIHEDQTLLAKGYGYRDLETRLPVTTKTLFPIASITKPFTATAAAILVDDGKLDWNDRVRDHLRAFRLFDEDAAAQLTIRDCLSHRTGLSLALFRWHGVKGWPEEHITPEIAYRTLRYLEPSAPARTTYIYSNSGYLITGQVIDKYGETWEEFLQSRLLDPLKMERTNFSVARSQADPDHAKPYDLFEGKVVRRPFFPLEVVAPIGGINSNVEEMARFLRLYLGQGALDGKRIVSKVRMKDLLTPEVVMPEFNHFKSTTGFHSMGWQLLMIQGEKWGRHTGSWPGFTAVAGFCPKRKCAYVVLTNLAYRPTAELIESNIRSRLLEQEPADQFELFRRIEANDRESFEKFRLERRPPRIKDAAPTHPLSDYVGTFSNPAYGDFVVSLHEGSLRWHHHGFRGSLRHYHYDVFDMEGDRDFNGIVDDDICRELVTFRANVSGTIESLSFPRFSMPRDVRFSRVTTHNDEGEH